MTHRGLFQLGKGWILGGDPEEAPEKVHKAPEKVHKK